MTWGQIAASLVRKYPEASIEDVEIAIQSAYADDVLGFQEWTRLNSTVDFALAPRYDAGSVTATSGSANITGTGTVWTPAMNGRAIEIGTHGLEFIFSHIGATSAQLNRPWPVETQTQTRYSIIDSIVALPPDLRTIESLTNLRTNRSLEHSTHFVSATSFNGEPDNYAFIPDQLGVQRIAIWPTPGFQGADLRLEYRVQAANYQLDSASSSPLAWVSPGAIIAAAEMRLTRDSSRFQQAQSLFNKSIQTMAQLDRERTTRHPVKARSTLNLRSRR